MPRSEASRSPTLLLLDHPVVVGLRVDVGELDRERAELLDVVDVELPRERRAA